MTTNSEPALYNGNSRPHYMNDKDVFKNPGTRERRFRWHWQNLTADCYEETTGRRRRQFPFSGRAWLHVFAWAFRVEWNLWSRSCGIGVELGGNDDDDITIYFALPPISFWFSVRGPYDGWLNRCLPQSTRECEISIHDWAVWISPWAKWGECNRSDPWWVRGVVFRIDDFFLGRIDHVSEERILPGRVRIDLDGHIYKGWAKQKRGVWWRRRWFAVVKDWIQIEMDHGHGLPYAGKGESAFDCGDDAICSWGVDGGDVEAAIQHGIEQVRSLRLRYGEPSRYGPVPVRIPADDRCGQDYDTPKATPAEDK